MRIIRFIAVAFAPALFAAACAVPPTDGSPLDRLKNKEDDVASDGSKKPSKKKEPDNQQPAPQQDTPPPATPQADQPPTLSSIAPEAITLGTSTTGVDVVLTGTRFPTGAQVDIAGTRIPANVASTTEIRIQIPADKVKAAGALRIQVIAKPGLESNALSFTVANPTVVTIASLNPANTVLKATNTDLPITVTGSGFTSQSVVRFNGTPLPTTFTSSTQLSATIPGISFSAAGRISVTVSTGADVVSLPSIFEIRNPSPSANTVTPATLNAGEGATVVTIAGSGFTKATEVFSGNTALATTFVSTTQLRATVPSFLIAAATTLNLVAKTGTPGGGTSTAVKVTVKAGQATQTAACAYKCADYGFKPFTCYSNWYCIGTGEYAGCLSQTPCTDTVTATGNPSETTQTTCKYKCTDYQYAPGECDDGWYCRYSDGCLVEDSTCKASTTTTTTNKCTYACADYGYVKGECSFGYYCQYSDGCLVQNSSCAGSGTSSGGSSGSSGGTSSTCTYKCSDYGYAPGDCDGGYYCRYSDGCLEADPTCN